MFLFHAKPQSRKGLTHEFRAGQHLYCILCVFAALRENLYFPEYFNCYQLAWADACFYFTQSRRATKGLRVNSLLVSILYCILCVFAALRENLYSPKLPEENFISQGPPAFFLSCLQVFRYLSCSCLVHLQ
jgi:fucose 4-O-acetylase-like acetyltransferase